MSSNLGWRITCNGKVVQHVPMLREARRLVEAWRKLPKGRKATWAVLDSRGDDWLDVALAKARKQVRRR